MSMSMSIWRKPVVTYASLVRDTLLASVNSVTATETIVGQNVSFPTS